MKRAVFLDRDGVVNDVVVKDGKPYPPTDVASVRIPEGTAEALARLKERGYLLVLVTNQPDVARGSQTRQNVDAISQQVRDELLLDDVVTCYHDDADECDCRKPKPGLILCAARRRGISVRDSYMIGDRWRDIDAGANAGCRTILIDRGYRERAPLCAPDHRVKSLQEAVDWILKDTPERL